MWISSNICLQTKKIFFGAFYIINVKLKCRCLFKHLCKNKIKAFLVYYIHERVCIISIDVDLVPVYLMYEWMYIITHIVSKPLITHT
jgi:hypothetical protein